MTNSNKINISENDVPLLVDLDGSLISSDTLYEMLVLLIKTKPWMVLFLPFWLSQGKQYLKRELFKHARVRATSLPYRESVLEFLKKEKSSGRQIILATGSWHQIAEDVCEHLPYFDEFVGTTEAVNLTGSKKADWASDKFGSHGYDYLGNESKDIAVWDQARKSVVVGNEWLAAEAANVSELHTHIPIEKPQIKTYLKAIRLHQWAKNVLLFVPLLTAHLFTDPKLIFEVFIGFLSFSLCASATYLVNDLFDLESDRKHPVKRHRPLASGKLSIPLGLIISCVLLSSSVILALALSHYFLFALLAYLIITILYSFKLKTLQTVDVITLAALFTLRVIAGAAAIEITLSFWLLSFSMFMFLSLAIVKRVSEIIRVSWEQEANHPEEKERISGRGYFTSDANILESLGSSSGFISVLVFALYINSEQVIPLYKIPEILWLMCPILGYWVMRIWMLAARGEMNEDPISFAITDRNSILAGILMLLVLGAATLV